MWRRAVADAIVLAFILPAGWAAFYVTFYLLPEHVLINWGGFFALLFPIALAGQALSARLRPRPDTV